MKSYRRPYPDAGNPEKRDKIIADIRKVCGWVPGAQLRRAK